MITSLTVDDVMADMARRLRSEKNAIVRTVRSREAQVLSDVHAEAGLTPDKYTPQIVFPDTIPQHMYAWVAQRLEKFPADLSSSKALDRIYVSFHKALMELFRRDPIDALGEYVYLPERAVEIRLYWMVITLTAERLKLDADELTVKVMVHEMAHFATHMGRDFNRRTWNSGFSTIDARLAEGLANYYSWWVLGRSPYKRDAFLALTRRQHPHYRAYKRLLATAGYRHHPELDIHDREASRSALVAFRRSEETSWKAYCKVLRRCRVEDFALIAAAF